MLTKVFWKAMAFLVVLNYRGYQTIDILSTGLGALAESVISGSGEEGTIDEGPRTPLYMLLLLMIPDSRDHAGWDAGPSLLAGARVALKEVNSRPGLLDGYGLEFIESGHEACGLPSTTKGVINLIDHAINPQVNHVKPVVAVGGLMCSGPTTVISPIAGKPGVDILHLSGSNSPLFVQNKQSYPYLWRFLVSASIFSDLLLDLMDEFDWTKVAVVYDTSVYYKFTALKFLNAIKISKDKNITWEVAINLSEQFYYDTVIKNIKDSLVRIIFTFTNSHQTAKLLCMANEEGLVSPSYQWVLADENKAFLTSGITDLNCSESELLAGADHSLMMYFQVYQDSDKTLVSNRTYKEYEDEYKKEFEQIQAEYNATFSPDPQYAGILYDQVWALAMALNTTIPILKKMNLSIEEYSYGQPEITNILQQQLSEVEFVGASSQVQFNHNREVLTKVNIFYLDNETEIVFGEYNGLDQVPLTLHVTKELPDDEWNLEISLLPVYVTCVLLAADGLVILFITLNLLLIIVYRKRPELKAISPFLSMLMFIGCYMLCASAICNIILIGFSIKERVFSTFCNLRFIFLINGVVFIFNTLFIRLLRIYKIFSNKDLSHMNKWVWNNCSLVVIILSLCLIPNVLLAIWLTTNPVSYNATVTVETFVEMSQTAQEISSCAGDNIGAWIGTFIGLAFLMAIFILILTINTRKIHYSNFKDTKKVNIFLGLLLTVCTVSTTVGLILQNTGIYFAAVDITIIVGISLFIPVLCQGFLFMPKVLPISCPNICLGIVVRTPKSPTFSRARRLSRTLSARLFW